MSKDFKMTTPLKYSTIQIFKSAIITKVPTSNLVRFREYRTGFAANFSDEASSLRLEVDSLKSATSI